MKKSPILSFLAMSAIASAMEQPEFSPVHREPKKFKLGNQVFEPKVPTNHKFFSFRIDGTFTCYQEQGPMIKSECVFSCFALNSKNAIRKFNQFQNK
jgi:hypothetical protein